MSNSHQRTAFLFIALLGVACQKGAGGVKLTQSDYRVDPGESTMLTVAVTGRLKNASWTVVNAPQCRGTVEKVGEASARFRAPDECRTGGANMLELRADFEASDPVTLAAQVHVSPRIPPVTPSVTSAQLLNVGGGGSPATPKIVPLFEGEFYRDFPAEGFISTHVVGLDALDVRFRNATGQGWGVVCVEQLKRSVDLTRYRTMTVDIGPGPNDVRGSGKLEIKLERPDSQSPYGGKIVEHLQLPLTERRTHTFELSGVDAPLLADTRRVCISSAVDKLQGEASVRLYQIAFR